MKLSSLSTEYVRVPVTVTDTAGTPIDPTGDPVQMAFTATRAEPDTGDWVTATWETSGSSHYARVLVGPGGTKTLTDGNWRIWVKVTDAPEVPVINAGALIIT